MLFALCSSTIICATNTNSQNQSEGDLTYKELLEQIDSAAQLQDDDDRKVTALRHERVSDDRNGIAKQQKQNGNEDNEVVAIESGSKCLKEAMEPLKQSTEKQQENSHEGNEDALADTEEESNLKPAKNVAKAEQQSDNAELQRRLRNKTNWRSRRQWPSTRRRRKPLQLTGSQKEEARRRGGQVRGGQRRGGWRSQRWGGRRQGGQMWRDQRTGGRRQGLRGKNRVYQRQRGQKVERRPKQVQRPGQRRIFGGLRNSAARYLNQLIRFREIYKPIVPSLGGGYLSNRPGIGAPNEPGTGVTNRTSMGAPGTNETGMGESLMNGIYPTNGPNMGEGRP